MTDSVYQLVDVTKRFGSVVANDSINLEVAEGEMVCLLGPNGAGKTTLVRQMLGLTCPTSGEIRLQGWPLGSGPASPSLVCGYLPRTAYPIREARAVEAVRLSAMLRGSSKADASRSAIEELENWGMSGAQRRLVGTLSGGERRLVGIACALVGDRPVLILDEPTNELDPEARAAVWRRLAEERSAGRTIIVISHNVFEVEAVATRAIIVADGHVVADGPIEEIRRRATPDCVVAVPFRGDHPPPIGKAAHVDNGLLEVKTPRSELRGVLASLVSDQRVEVEGLQIRGASLQDAYLRLVGTNDGSHMSRTGPR